MEIGRKYLVVKPAHSFGEIDGELVDFAETRTEIEVLPKPQTVLMFDGDTEEVEPLPMHLAQDDWFLVRDIKTGITSWLNTAGRQITKL